MPHFAMSCRQNAAVGPSRQRRSRPFHEREALSLVQWSRADGVSPRNGTANQTRRRSHRACCARAARHLLRRIRADCPGRRSRVLLRNLDPPGARHQLLPLPWRRACLRRAACRFAGRIAAGGRFRTSHRARQSTGEPARTGDQPPSRCVGHAPRKRKRSPT